MCRYADLRPYLEEGLLSEQRHPEAPYLVIVNYTNHCQYAQSWDTITMACRGLILDTRTDTVVARPFPKFFNYEEHVAKGRPIPNEPPIITEKLDGSLGILFWTNNEPWIATRGSFVSEQAKWATTWLRSAMSFMTEQEWERLRDPHVTHLFEIIYKENRIVVNYDFEGLVYLGTRGTLEGQELPEYPFPLSIRRAQRIQVDDYQSLAALDTPNAEGFVILLPASGLRLKIKFATYVKLHKVLTGLSVKGIWEILRDGQDLDAVLDGVPDELLVWFHQVKDNLLARYADIAHEAEQNFRAIQRYMGQQGWSKATHRKEIALVILNRINPSMLFSLLDGKSIDQQIWKQLRPVGTQTFKEDLDHA